MPSAVRELVMAVETFEGTETQARQQMISTLDEASVLPDDMSITSIYEALARAQRIPSFGQVRRRAVTASQREKADIAAALTQMTGLPLSALTPRQPPVVLLQLATVAAFSLLAYVSRQLHLGSIVRPTLYTVLAGLAFDQVALRGVLFDRAYAAVNPGYVERVITHEAGHFLAAYLYGLPVQRYALTTGEAVAARVPGQAATLFADDDLSTQLTAGQVAGSSVDRYCVVAMAGIAAEGMRFGEASGGEADVAALVRLLGDLQPAWQAASVRVQGRWAVVQAVLLLREHSAMYDALRDAMEMRLSLGACVARMEEAFAESADGDDGADNQGDVVEPGKVENLEKEREAKETEAKELASLEEREQMINDELDRVERKVRSLDDVEPDPK